MGLHSGTLATALILTTLPVWQASALPAKPFVGVAEIQFVHHKPWHRGGPPWLRRGDRGFGDLYARERGRSWEDMRRPRWQEERRYEDRIERPRRSYRFDDD